MLLMLRYTGKVPEKNVLKKQHSTLQKTSNAEGKYFYRDTKTSDRREKNYLARLTLYFEEKTKITYLKSYNMEFNMTHVFFTFLLMCVCMLYTEIHYFLFYSVK